METRRWRPIGIVFKANMFITFLQMGLANGVQPLLGYNYGSGDGKRFRAVESFTKRSCLVVGILATLLYFALREPIIRLFINDDEVVAYGVEMLTAYMLSGACDRFPLCEHEQSSVGGARP